MSTPPVDLVCLDIGGVLVRILDDWRHTFAHTGTPLPGDRLDDPAVMARLRHDLIEFESGRTDEAAFFETYAHIIGLSRQQVEACFAAWIVQVYEGVDALLHALSEADVAVACLSNTNTLHWRMMQSPGPVRLPLDRLDHRFTSFQIGAMKPTDAIYAHVEAVTKIEPSRIAFFDDLSANIDAAQRRGWRAYHIDSRGDTAHQVTDHLRTLGVLR